MPWPREEAELAEVRADRRGLVVAGVAASRDEGGTGKGEEAGLNEDAAEDEGVEKRPREETRQRVAVGLS